METIVLAIALLLNNLLWIYFVVLTQQNKDEFNIPKINIVPQIHSQVKKDIKEVEMPGPDKVLDDFEPLTNIPLSDVVKSMKKQ